MLVDILKFSLKQPNVVNFFHISDQTKTNNCSFKYQIDNKQTSSTDCLDQLYVLIFLLSETNKFHFHRLGKSQEQIALTPNADYTPVIMFGGQKTIKLLLKLGHDKNKIFGILKR